MSNYECSIGSDAQKDLRARPNPALQAILDEIHGFMQKQAVCCPKAQEQSLEQILNRHKSPEPHTRIFADSYGRITNMALMLSPYPGHLGPDKRAQMMGAYKTLFTEMEPDTKFTVVVETDKDKSDVEKVISDNHVQNPGRITFLKPNVGELTIWARDMMVGMYKPGDPKHTALLNQTTLHSWHLNDMKVAGKIAAANPSIVLDKEPFIVSDGGDVESNTKEAFTGYYSVVSTEIKIAEALAKDPALKAKVFDYYKKHYGKEVVEPKPAGDGRWNHVQVQ